MNSDNVDTNKEWKVIWLDEYDAHIEDCIIKEQSLMHGIFIKSAWVNFVFTIIGFMCIVFLGYSNIDHHSFWFWLMLLPLAVQIVSLWHLVCCHIIILKNLYF